MTTIRASRIFDGKDWLTNQIIHVENGTLSGLEDDNGGAVDLTAKGTVFPPLVDFQVYGAGGKLFSLYPDPQTLWLMEESFRKEGTILFQPTIATNSSEVVNRAITAFKEYRSGGGKAAVGLHLEGPWINAQTRGAHLEAFVRAPELEEVKELINGAEGSITTITIAPECCKDEIIRYLVEAGIIVSAGHTMASFEESKKAFSLGIPTVTHLFNAMPPFHHREPGIIGALFEDDRVLSSIIPDGHHVHFSALTAAKKIMGERLFAITDAVTETAEGPYKHKLEGEIYTAGGILSGSAISMLDAFRNLVKNCGIETGEAHRMCSLYPARLMKQGGYGTLKTGNKAAFLLLEEEGLQFRDLIILN